MVVMVGLYDPKSPNVLVSETIFWLATTFETKLLYHGTIIIKSERNVAAVPPEVAGHVQL